MRRLLWLACLLLPLALSAQPVARDGHGNTVLWWEYPLEWQERVTFEATVIGVVGGQAARRTEPVRPLARADCQVLAAASGEDWTEETMCAEVCLPVGDSTTTLVATDGRRQSESSNEADAQHAPSCVPVTPPPTKPPSNKPSSTLPGWAVGAGAAVVTGTVVGGGSTPSLPELVNRHCVTWRIIGPCVCPPFTPCVKVEYWEPTSLIEIVKQPGTTTLPILGDLLKAGLRALGVTRFGGGGAGNASGSGHTNLQYAEAHVWSFPQLFGGPCTACAPVNALPILQYASEADLAWRTTVAPAGLPAPARIPIGVWGPLFPRVGFVTEPSAPVASGLQGFRALNIAFQPVTALPAPEAHVAISPPLGLSGCMQLASPKQTACFPAGTPGPVWDYAAVSPQGSYLWIIWTKRSCCVPPPGTCGITLPAIGGHGANLCPL